MKNRAVFAVILGLQLAAALKLPKYVHEKRPEAAKYFDSWVAKALVLAQDGRHGKSARVEDRAVSVLNNDDFYSSFPPQCRPQVDAYVNLFRAGSCQEMVQAMQDDGGEETSTVVLDAICNSACYPDFLDGLLTLLDCSITHDTSLTPAQKELTKSLLGLFPAAMEWMCTKFNDKYCNILASDPVYQAVEDSSVTTPGNVSVFTTDFPATPENCAALQESGCCVASYANFKERAFNIFFGEDSFFSEFIAEDSKKMYYAFEKACGLGELNPCIVPGRPRKVAIVIWILAGLDCNVFLSANENKKYEFRLALRQIAADVYSIELGQVEMGADDVGCGSWVVNLRLRGRTDAETDQIISRVNAVNTSTFDNSTIAGVVSIDASAQVGSVSFSQSVAVVTEGQVNRGSSSSSSNAGLIAGVTVAVLVVAIAAGVAVWYFHFRPKQQGNQGNMQRMTSEGEMAAVTLQQGGAVPHGWVEEQDPKTGVVTWRNTTSGQIVWERPMI